MKKSVLVTAFMLIALSVYSQTEIANNGTIVSIGKGGVGLGSAISVTISWDKNKSIKWAILHGVISWFYVIYHFFTRK
jgi:hypothetical protein